MLRHSRRHELDRPRDNLGPPQTGVQQPRYLRNERTRTSSIVRLDYGPVRTEAHLSAGQLVKVATLPDAARENFERQLIKRRAHCLHGFPHEGIATLDVVMQADAHGWI